MSGDWLTQLTPDNLKRALRIAAALRPIADARIAEGFSPEELIHAALQHEAAKLPANAPVCVHNPQRSELDQCRVVNAIGRDGGTHSGEGANKHACTALPHEGPDTQSEGEPDGNSRNENYEDEDEFTQVFADVLLRGPNARSENKPEATSRNVFVDEDEDEFTQPFADVTLMGPNARSDGELGATSRNEFVDENEDEFTQLFKDVMPTVGSQRVPTELARLAPSSFSPSALAFEEVGEVQLECRPVHTIEAKLSKQALDREVSAGSHAVGVMRSSARIVRHPTGSWQ